MTGEPYIRQPEEIPAPVDALDQVYQAITAIMYRPDAFHGADDPDLVGINGALPVFDGRQPEATITLGPTDVAAIRVHRPRIAQALRLGSNDTMRLSFLPPCYVREKEGDELAPPSAMVAIVHADAKRPEEDVFEFLPDIDGHIEGPDQAVHVQHVSGSEYDGSVPVGALDFISKIPPEEYSRTDEGASALLRLAKVGDDTIFSVEQCHALGEVVSLLSINQFVPKESGQS